MEPKVFELYSFKKNLPSVLRMTPDGLFIRHPKPKVRAMANWWTFTPVSYDDKTMTLTYLRGTGKMSYHWPDEILDRMETRQVPVKITEYQ